MKILHITFHDGCEKTLNFVSKMLGYDIVVQRADWNYNIGYDRANELWNRYKDYYK